MRVKAWLVGGIVASAAWATPMVADAGLSECGSNRMCLWGNNDFRWKVADRAHGSGRANLSGDANDEMDSWANRSANYSGCMYEHANGRGDKQGMGKNSKDNNVNPANSDEVSSWKQNGGC